MIIIMIIKNNNNNNNYDNNINNIHNNNINNNSNNNEIKIINKNKDPFSFSLAAHWFGIPFRSSLLEVGLHGEILVCPKISIE